MEQLSKRSIFKLLTTVLVSVSASAAAAAPVTNTHAYIDSFTAGGFLAQYNLGGGPIDRTYTEGSGAPGEYTVTGRARAYASTSNGQYALGARAELTAEFVPASLMQPVQSLYNTAEAMAIAQIEDQLTFTVQGSAPGDWINVSFTYHLSGAGSTCTLVGCISTYGPGEIPATEVYGEATSIIGTGFQSQTQTKRIDFPAPGSAFTHTFSVQNGDTRNYFLDLTARVFSTSEDAKTQNLDNDPGYFSVRGDANYYSTLTITGIEAFDLSGTPLPGFTVLNSSGVALSAVPVPPALWLFGSGLLGLIGIARRKG